MLTRMRGFFSLKEINTASLTNEFACFQHSILMKIPGSSFMSSYRFGHKLFDLHQDPKQEHLIELSEESEISYLIETTAKKMFAKMGLSEGHIQMIMKLIACADKSE